MSLAATSAPIEPPHGHQDDFDFLFGDWQVANRRLTARWTSRPHWDVFSGAQHCEPRLGALANVDEIVFPDRGYAGMTLRVFDLRARRWSIWWVSSRDGVLTPPVQGGFMGDRGEFYGEDLDDGRPVQVRFLWLKHAVHGGPRWEQAFSLDGHAWQTNWIMDLSRA
ncbi:MAG TPA: hypothetical protein VFE03_03150 [Caulobacteraceae bacterium]|jgi:hypothetical protein|nr:hypothetical protein [Caulobacteraceae bacterium]